MSFLRDYWKRMPQRWRLVVWLFVTGVMAVFATILLVRNGLKDVLYKGF